MHWQDACFDSQTRTAYRRTRDGRLVVRHWDGKGDIQVYDHPDSWREAHVDELEGFNDWQPDSPKKKALRSVNDSGTKAKPECEGE